MQLDKILEICYNLNKRRARSKNLIGIAILNILIIFLSFRMFRLKANFHLEEDNFEIIREKTKNFNC